MYGQGMHTGCYITMETEWPHRISLLWSVLLFTVHTLHTYWSNFPPHLPLPLFQGLEPPLQLLCTDALCCLCTTCTVVTQLRTSFKFNSQNLFQTRNIPSFKCHEINWAVFAALSPWLLLGQPMGRSFLVPLRVKGWMLPVALHLHGRYVVVVTL